MKANRPHHGAKADANQKAILREIGMMLGGWQRIELPSTGKPIYPPSYSGYYRGQAVVIMDMSSVGGLCLDLRVYANGTALDVEIKDNGKRGDLTEGEWLYFETLEATGRIIQTSEELYIVIGSMFEKETA
jgi:hypothetical protein